MRIRSVFSHSIQAVAEGALIALIVVGLIAGTALAGKPTRGGPTGSCSVTPGQVAVAADWTLDARNLGANRFVMVRITNGGSTTAFNLGSDAAGSLSLTWHSYWAGAAKVELFDNGGRKLQWLTTCTFEVV